MDNAEARSILSAHRASDPVADDARFEAARKQAETDPALAHWWDEDQELDRMIGQKLEGVRVPAGLKVRLLTAEAGKVPARVHWPRKIALLAAAIVLLAVFFGSWRGLFQPATSLAEFRDEMVSFVRLDPELDIGSSEMWQVNAFLEANGAPPAAKIPAALLELKPVGCRTLRFRGEDVALICFRRAPDDYVHLFVVNRKSMAKVNRSSADPEFATEGEWTTAAWVEGENTYLVAAKGDRAGLAKYLGTS